MQSPMLRCQICTKCSLSHRQRMQSRHAQRRMYVKRTHMRSQITHTARHLQERCSDIWMCEEEIIGMMEIWAQAYAHILTHTNLFPWHTREENIEMLARGRSMGLCGLMVWKRWAEERRISDWNPASIVQNGLQLQIQQTENVCYGHEPQPASSSFNQGKVWVHSTLSILYCSVDANMFMDLVQLFLRPSPFGIMSRTQYSLRFNAGISSNKQSVWSQDLHQQTFFITMNK